MVLTVGELFAGIGGIGLGFERAGMEVRWQVEIDDYATRVLEKHWPDVLRFRDVRDCGAHNLPAVDVIAGGWPCQPFSTAGKRRGKDDDRHLWPEMFRVVDELRPSWVVGENVAGINNMVLDEILSDLEALGYEAVPIGIPAASVGAWHRRYRTFVVANLDSTRKLQPQGCIGKFGRRPDNVHERDVSDIESQGLADRDEEQSKTAQAKGIMCGSERSNWWTHEPGVVRMVHGFSSRLDGRKRRERIKCLGNAVVPQVAEVIGRAIVAVENDGC